MMICHRDIAWDKQTGYFGTIFALLPSGVSSNYFLKNRQNTYRYCDLCTKKFDQISVGCRAMAATNRQVILGQFMCFYPPGRSNK